MIKNIEISKELESPEYSLEYNKLLEIHKALLFCLRFSSMNCMRSTELPRKLFFLSVIDDILQSGVTIKVLSSSGIRNTCRRELRYLLELAVKSCYVSQRFSGKTIEEQIIEYKKDLKSTDISMVEVINLDFFEKETKNTFSKEVKRMYGLLCKYVHATPHQMQERIKMIEKGRFIGFEGINELHELIEEIKKVYTYVLVLLFHSVPQWCVGGFLVESDGFTIDWYFNKSKYIAEIDSNFDYKYERQSRLTEIVNKRTKMVEF